MLMLHLIKKDILIAKGAVLISVVMVIALPSFFAFQAPFLAGTLSFLYMVGFVEIILLNNISWIESKSLKAPALLCAAPYTRMVFVRAKYLFFVFLFVVCYAVHSLMALFLDPSTILDLTSVLAVLLFGVVIYGIYMPIEFKYGNVKARLIFIVMIFMFSLGPIAYTSFLADLDFSALSSLLAAIPGAVMCIILALLSAAVFAGSMALSTRIFAKKEL